MPLRKLKAFLDDHHVQYRSVAHSPAVTAQETAESAHIPGKELAKTVMIKVDGKMAMAVVPACDHIDMDRLKHVIGAGTVSLASEGEFKGLFSDCEIGAMPPFGNLYGMEVFVSSRLAEDEQIAFNAGSHSELIKLAYADFARLVQPRVLQL